MSTLFLALIVFGTVVTLGGAVDQEIPSVPEHHPRDRSIIFSNVVRKTAWAREDAESKPNVPFTLALLEGLFPPRRTDVTISTELDNNVSFIELPLTGCGDYSIEGFQPLSQAEEELHMLGLALNSVLESMFKVSAEFSRTKYLRTPKPLRIQVQSDRSFKLSDGSVYVLALKRVS